MSGGRSRSAFPHGPTGTSFAWQKTNGPFMAGIRKLATILESDVVGYDRLTGSAAKQTRDAPFFLSRRGMPTIGDFAYIA